MLDITTYLPRRQPSSQITINSVPKDKDRGGSSCLGLGGHINPSQLKEQYNWRYTKWKHDWKWDFQIANCNDYSPKEISHCWVIDTKKHSKTKTNKNFDLKAWVLEHALINPYDCREHNWRRVIDPSQETGLTTQMCDLFAVWTWPRH